MWHNYLLLLLAVSSYQASGATLKMAVVKMAARQHGVRCDIANPCNNPFQCSSVGICVCPLGYYGSEDGTTCFAELGSPSTEEQCVGFLAVVENGICTCPANFFYSEGMRDCTKGVAPGTLGVWQCVSDADCAGVAGSVCEAGACGCPATQQVVAGGTRCADFAPYLTSPCVDDFQCERLFTSFQCRRGEDQSEGNCFCQPNHHYYLGRCWSSIGMGDACSRNEECLGVIRDPHAMTCDQSCRCADGYYSRQRGECRKIGAAIGDRCVLDEDCQFANGACDGSQFTCYDANNPSTVSSYQASNATLKMAVVKMAARQHGVRCDVANPCNNPFQCSSVGICVCPLGYYGSEDGTTCFAELGSPSTEEQCVGFLAVVENGICTCPANFFYSEGMRDCTKVARSVTDFCLSDEQCHTFGAASYCAPPGQWGLRTCACNLEEAVWDAQRSMCRLFAGVGEACQVDSDCMAGELEIQCQLDAGGEGFCACPEGLVAVNGLCLTSGLDLGDECQMSVECTEAENSVCADGRCACDDGYQQVGNVCAPTIGGSCSLDEDCVIEHTVCSGASERSCQCNETFVEYGDKCWLNSLGYNESCSIDAQCLQALGPSGSCQDGGCLCGGGHHYRDDACWAITGIFESCSRSSECYLGDITDRLVCRNSLCQCDFQFPYSEELGTCTSSANSFARVANSVIMILTALAYVLNG